MSAPPPAVAERSQADRLLEIETVLGRDKLLLVGLDGEEQISHPFSYTATMLSTDHDIRPDKLIGSNATAWVMRGDGERAPVNGFIRRFTAGPVGAHEMREYRAELVPWLWFLTCTTDCRIFQNVTVPELVRQVFDDFGLVNYSVEGLTGTYPKLEYCVQYRESAFSFVSRWMEEAGLFYFFTHEVGKHTLVLADRNFQFQPAAESDAIYAGKDGTETNSHVTRWQHAYEFRPGRYAQNDFNFETPSATLLTHEASVLGIPHADAFELYEYPGRYAKMDHGQSLTRARIEEEEARYHTVEGDSGYASFRAGHRFTLARHDIPTEEGKTYVLFRVSHRARDTSHLAADVEPSSYRNSFVAMPADVRFRAARKTRCPVMQGPQTAIVVGPPGETIHTDKHGRVKLQFHWDREGKRDDRSSCWVRVSQAWAGGGWGGVNIPHVGHEVVVSFLEGDPDRPLVTGRVYNGENTKAVGLPANKTQSAMRDHSGNEILMEGKKGSQDVRVTAVKDMHETVINDREISVGGTHKEFIKKDTTIAVTEGNYVHSVSTGTAEYHVNGNITETYHDHQFTNVNSDVVVKSLYSKIFLEAALAIQLTSGASQITLDKDGNITIVGKTIKILGNDRVTVAGDAVGVQGGNETKIGVGSQSTVYDKQKVTTSGAGISSNAVGEHGITGAIVKIN